MQGACRVGRESQLLSKLVKLTHVLPFATCHTVHQQAQLFQSGVFSCVPSDVIQSCCAQVTLGMLLHALITLVAPSLRCACRNTSHLLPPSGMPLSRLNAPLIGPLPSLCCTLLCQKPAAQESGSRGVVRAAHQPPAATHLPGL